MKLLLITQAVDSAHPVLGFFHRWIEEFAKHYEHIHVIGLQVGSHSLPSNVTVHSLGKEKGAGKLQRLYTLYTTLFALHRHYDAVFVHMNPEYVVLAGWLWRLAGKKVALWYNHTVGSFWLRLAQPFTNRVLYTSPYAYTARYKNAERMPAGIDTEVFTPHPEVRKIPRSVYFQGRVAPAKNVHVILEAFAELHARGNADLLTVVGPEDEGYTKPLRERYAELITKGAIVFKGPVPNAETPTLFAAHAVSVNVTARGNYDKTVLESLACGTPVIVASDAFTDVVPEEWCISGTDVSALQRTLERLFETDVANRLHVEKSRKAIVKAQSLDVLQYKVRSLLELRK